MLILNNNLAHVGISFAKGYQIYKILSGGKAIKDAIVLAKGAVDAIKAIKTIGDVGTTALKAVSTVKAGFASSGVGLIVAAIIQIAEIFLVNALSWLEHRNMVCLLPLWWENYPFVCNVKDGEKILLIDSNATATNEQQGWTSGEENDTENTRFD